MKTIIVIILCFISFEAKSTLLSSSEGVYLPKIGLVPGGILFPKLAFSAEVNAAAMVREWVTAGEVLVSPAQSDLEPNGIRATLTSISRGGLGIGAGYIGSNYKDHYLSGGFIGFGLKIKKTTVGASLRQLVFTNKIDPMLDIGFTFQPFYPFLVGAVLYDIKGYKNTTVGIGINIDKSFWLESNFVYPLYEPMSTMADYRILVSTGIRWGIVSLSTVARYSKLHNNTTELQYTAGASVWLNSFSALTVEVGYPKTISVGFSIAFLSGEAYEMESFREYRGF